MVILIVKLNNFLPKKLKTSSDCRFSLVLVEMFRCVFVQVFARWGSWAVTGVPVHCCNTSTGARDILWRYIELDTGYTL